MADDRLHSETEIKKLLPVPVICEIPVITGPRDGQIPDQEGWGRWTAAALVISAILAGSVFSYLHG